MRIYTRTGDKGTTALVSGERVAKTDLRVAACGTLDELSTHIGVAIANGAAPEVADLLAGIQRRLFAAGADVSAFGTSAAPMITDADVHLLESGIDRMDSAMPHKKAFILPGGSPPSAHIHVARAVCRRAERDALAAFTEPGGHPPVLLFLNRLSDFLFVLARYQNHLAGVDELPWQPDGA